MAKMEHDFAALDAAMAKTLPLEEAMVLLNDWHGTHRTTLVDVEKEHYINTMRALSLLLQTVIDRTY